MASFNQAVMKSAGSATCGVFEAVSAQSQKSTAAMDTRSLMQHNEAAPCPDNLSFSLCSSGMSHAGDFSGSAKDLFQQG